MPWNLTTHIENLIFPQIWKYLKYETIVTNNGL
jgi:hypothetical protein